MFELKFCIDTDGDFGYEHTEFDTEFENIIYFEKVEDAFSALKKIVGKVCDTFYSSRGYTNILDWFKDLRDTLEKVHIEFCDDLEYEGDFGNQSCYFYLKECHQVAVGKGFRFSSMFTTRKENIDSMIQARIEDNELTPCVFYVSKTVDSKYVQEVKNMFDKYGIPNGEVDTLEGAFNLNRDWIETDRNFAIPCAVEYCGCYPANWEIDDVLRLVELEKSGLIQLRIYIVDDNDLKPMV